MTFVERLVDVFAPHYCISCSNEGTVVCDWCFPDFASPIPSRCFLCKAVSIDSKVCQKCQPKVKLKHVWVRTFYEGNAKQLIHDFKFERKRAASEPIARLMKQSLPFFGPKTIITHIPTATRRVRKRGYDHAELIALELSNQLSLTRRKLLYRTTQTRQVGSKRDQRIQQMKQAFVCANREITFGSSILLVDDLATTGATLGAAALCLKQAGAKSISAVVFAQK